MTRFRKHGAGLCDMVMAAGLAMAFSAVSALAAAPQTVSMTCRFDTPQFATGTNGYSIVTVGGCETHARAGYPRLPYRIVRLLLPPGSGVADVAVVPQENTAVLDGNWLLDFGRQPRPIGQPQSPSAAPDGPDPAVYGSTNPIPGSLAQLVSVQRMAGHDIAILRVFPLQYTPAAGRLEFTPVVRVDLTLSNRTDTAARIGPRSESLVRSLDRARVAAFVDNPAALSQYSVPQPLGGTGGGGSSSNAFNYLLVTRQSLLAAFQPLVDLKTADGLIVHTETMENITTNYPGVDLAEKLRNCIRYAYTNGGVEYVLLGGDIATVPRRGAYGYCAGADLSIPCDLYFACLDGTWNRNGGSRWGEPTDGDGGGDVDLLAEVYVGRAPVDTPEETAIFVAKTIAYETAGAARPFAAICAGETLDTFGAQGGDALDKLIPALSNGSFKVQWLDDRPHNYATWTNTDSIAALNGSPHLVIHQGHADETTVMRLSVTDLDALTNQTPFFFYSAGCRAGAFDDPIGPDCIGEELVKRNAAGAFGAILNSRNGWFDSLQEWRYSGEFQQAFLDQLLSQGNTTLGKAHQLAKQAMVGNVETSGDMPYRWCYFDLILFGDPHTPLFTPIVMEIGGASDHSNAGRVLQWNSLSNRLYSVERATDLASGFVCVGSNIVATPPMNTYTDSASVVKQSFYRVRANH
jgi:hypothetical protein